MTERPQAHGGGAPGDGSGPMQRLWHMLRHLPERLRAARHQRSRLAERLPRPSQVLRRDWRAVVAGVWRGTNENDVFLLAAAVAFFAFLSLFPALSLLVSIYGLVADPAHVSRQLEAMQSVLPPGGVALVEANLRALTESPNPSLGLGVAVSAVFGLWSSMRGSRALIIACNRIHRRRERRGFVALQGVSLALTIFALLYATVAILLLVLVPATLRLLPRAPVLIWLAGAVRWPLLAILMMIFLAVVYRLAPSRQRRHPAWVSWGSALGTALWLIASGLFTTYVAYVPSYSQIYGTLAGVMVTLVWLYLSAVSVLVGVELNVELRRVAVVRARTDRDSTPVRTPVSRRPAPARTP
ncbi:MAG TPA: YihY/virulence factor BrkB family protein [Thermoanaerobaculia bacterium]|nr:YihY/virulence factor BrkB family protein [Thermoanaerobaculia bacterium]